MPRFAKGDEEMGDDKELKPMEASVAAIAGRAYNDVAHPTLAHLGELLVRGLRVASSPLRAGLWTFEQAEKWLANGVATRLKRIPPDQVIAPSRLIAIQAIAGLSLTGGEPVLREMFANLVASTMDSHKAPYAHPSFAEKIKQMSPDEARILKYLAKQPQAPVVTRQLERGAVSQPIRFTSLGRDASCENGSPISVTLAIDNLEHLDLLERPHWNEFIHGANYDELVALSGTYQVEGAELNGMPQCGSIRLSAIGSAFVDVCLSEEEAEIG